MAPCLLCALGGHWLASLRPSAPPSPVVVPEIVHSLNEGTSELERVLWFQHDLLKLCERPTPPQEAGWDLKSLLLPLLVGLVVVGAGGFYAATRFRKAGAAVATATVHHDSRAVRLALPEPTRGRPRAVSSPPSSSPAGSDIGDSPLRSHRGRILQ